MKQDILTQIENAEIDLQPYDSSSRSLHTREEVRQRRESLLKNGLINSIVITEDENNVPLIVDGNLRYNLIRELNIAKKNNQTLHSSIYGQAKIIVDDRHKPPYERLIRKQATSDTETEEIKNALFDVLLLKRSFNEYYKFSLWCRIMGLGLA